MLKQQYNPPLHSLVVDGNAYEHSDKFNKINLSQAVNENFLNGDFKDLIAFAMLLDQDGQFDLTKDAVRFLETSQNSPLLSREAISANIKGLATGLWAEMASLMLSEDIFSQKNIALIVAPYHVRRPGVKQKLSLLLCKRLCIQKFPFNFADLWANRGDVDFRPIIPIEILYSTGNISGSKGETFIVPTAWKTIPEAASASPLLDVIGAHKRVQEMATDEFVYCLCDERAANDLIAFRNNTADIVLSRYWEYSLHEYGHAEGLFSQRMCHIRGNMQQAALEEWRSDGIMAGLVDRHVELGNISEEQGRNILMSNFLTRFGMDVVRNKNKIDHDVLAGYYIFSSLERTGLIHFNEAKLKLLGDTSKYSFWRQLYALFAKQASIVTNLVKETKSNIDFIPMSKNVNLEEFVKFIESAIDWANAYTAMKPRRVDGK